MQTPMFNAPDFNSIDWVSLARGLGIYLPSDEPFEMSKYSSIERQALAEHLADVVRNDPTLREHYVSDYLDNLIVGGSMTSFDKAWIRLLINRLLK